MKHKMWSRLLSMALAVMMIASIVPNSAFAEAGSELAASSQVVTEMVEGTEEVTQPEETTGEEPAEQPAGEPAPTAEPVAEPTAEPVTESEQPTAEPTQAPVETAVPSEQPSAEPSAAPEGTQTPEGTEAPEGTAVPSETPAASATPAPSESPVPSETPAPSEEPAIDGQALLDELMAIEDDEAFLKAVSELTEEQTAALEALGEEALADYALRVETLTVAQQQEEKFTELYEKLMAAETWEEFETLFNELSEEERVGFEDWLTEEQIAELNNKFETLYVVEDQPEDSVFIPPVDFTNAAPLLSMLSNAPLRSRAAMLAAPFASGSNPATNDYSPFTEDKDGNGLAVGKTVKETATGYEINLEVYANGTVTSSTSTKPTDIVLVLDVSGSMANCINCGENSYWCRCEKEYTKVAPADVNADSGKEYYIKGGYNGYQKVYWCDQCEKWTTNSWSFHRNHVYEPGTSDSGKNNRQFYIASGGFESRIDALKKAATTFVNNVQTSNAGVDANKQHRIALVKFSSSSSTLQGLTNVNETGATNLNNAIKNLNANGSTAADYGMERAKNILNEARDVQDYDRNQVVIFFTDGEPNHGNGFSPNVANAAIASAKAMKDKGVTIYTIGVFSGANGSNPGQLDGISNTNRYMHLMSSNYPKASDLNQPGAINPDLKDKSYFLSASDSGKLEDIFETISNEIQNPSITLGTETVIRDVIDDHFELTGDITVSKVDSDGNNGWKTPEEIETQVTPTGQTVEVTGIDISKHFVSKDPRTNPDDPNSTAKDYYGSKYVITIPVKVREGFYGGNDVTTNTSASGVYDETGALVDSFPMPSVDIAITYDFTTKSQTIYLGDDPDYSKLIDFLQNQPGTSLYGSAQNNDYVDLVYTVKDQKGVTVGTYTIEAGQSQGIWQKDTNYTAASPEACTEYSVSCKVQPIYTGKVQDADKGPKTAQVHVLYPTVQAVDEYIALGESTTFEKCWNSVSEGWYDAHEEHTNRPAPTTAAPAITDVKVQEVGEGKDVLLSDITVSPKQDTDYNIVAVKLGNEDSGWITDPNKFKVNPDSESEHGTNGHYCIKPTTGSGDHDFTIHVYSVNGELTIKKSVTNWNSAKGGDAAFVFKIEGGGKTYYCTIDLSSTNLSDSKTITLPVGEYTVTELPTSGYQLDNTVDGNTKERSVDVSGSAGDPVEFTNTSDGDKIPGDNSSVLNKWIGGLFQKVTSEAANG